MATLLSFADGDSDNMNASLWGELQNFIDLSMIYAKLPLASFFHLRQVCKEWNHLASNRQFLEQNFKPPISSNPYFVLPRPSGGHVFLTSEGSSWSSTPMPQMQCEVSGLLFDNSKYNRVFDLHTRVVHTLPLQGEEGNFLNFKDPLIVMTVDKTLIPYGFRIILVDNLMRTKIYDSNSGAWTHNYPSTSINAYFLRALYYACVLGTPCIHYNKSLYIRLDFHYFERQICFLIFDLERNKWNYQWFWFPMDMEPYSDIGVWQDRWFVIATNASLDLLVWESLPNFEKPWNLFDCMPKDLCNWMQGLEYGKIMTKFCGEHMLLYNRVGSDERVVLYNLDQKTWEKIVLPTTMMSSERVCS